MPPITRAALVLSTLLLPIIAAAGLTDAERAQQAELLAWVRTLQFQGRTDEATELCALILAADPQCAEALTQRGIILLGESAYEAARADFDAALRADPGLALALVGRARAQQALGQTEAMSRDARRAVEVCSRALEARPDDARTHYVRGLARLLLAQENEALEDFVIAGDLDEGLVEARSEQGHIYRRRGRFAEAVAQFSAAVAQRPDYAVGYLERARARFEAKDLLAARDDCDRALQINPRYSRAWHNRGLINIQLGEVLAAVQDLTRAITARPGYASAHYYRGEAYWQTGNRGAARADWETARDLAGDDWPGPTAAEMLRKIEAGEL